MFSEMLDARPSTTSSAIRAFEQDRRLSLPKAYKEFLLSTNGGIPKKSKFPVADRLNDPSDEVQCFLGIGVPVPTSELSYAYDIYRGGIPEAIVPIADQAFGNYICLDLRGGRERVVLWDHRHFWSTGEWREEDLYDVAETFEKFLGSLMSAAD